MSETVLILSPDDELRERLCQEVARAGWDPVGFAHGESAFLCACGRVATLSAAILDQAAGAVERATLLRRLHLLRPDIRAMLLTREEGLSRWKTWVEDGPAPASVESEGTHPRSLVPGSTG